MRISEMPSPTGSQSPKLPSVALRRRARMRAFPLASDNPDNHASNAGDQRTVLYPAGYERVNAFDQCDKRDSIKSARL